MMTALLILLPPFILWLVGILEIQVWGRRLEVTLQPLGGLAFGFWTVTVIDWLGTDRSRVFGWPRHKQE